MSFSPAFITSSLCIRFKTLGFDSCRRVCLGYFSKNTQAVLGWEEIKVELCIGNLLPERESYSSKGY